MPTQNEQDLLREFVAARSDSAFERLVAKHIDLVFACALRRTGNPELSEEIAQTVFTILARKAHRLKAGGGLAGWLHKTTLYESKKALRGESRRKRKMKALAEQQQDQALKHNREAAGAGADEILPLVDEAIDELPDDDRRLILMHYFEGRTFGEISQSVGKSEAASQKQASRALGKLEKILRRRGVVASATGLATVLAAEAAKAAPAGIISSISGGAIAGASGLGSATLITNTIQTMTYAKTKVAILVATAAAVPIGVQVNSNANLKEKVRELESREEQFVERGERLAKLEAQIAHIPAEFFTDGTGGSSSAAGKDPIIAAHLKRQRAGMVKLPNKKSNSAFATSGSKGGALSVVDPDAETFDLLENDEPIIGGQSLTDMMRDPAMRTLIKKQMEVQLEMTYGDFLDYLELDDETQVSVKEALLQRVFGLADIDGKGDSDPALDDNAILKGLLGEEDFAEFIRFEDSDAERRELASFRAVLEDAGGDLTFETEQELMGIMHEERMKPSSELETHIAEGGDFDPGSSEATKMVLDMQRDLNRRIRTRVSEVLEGESLEVFIGNQESHLRLMMRGLEMQSLMKRETEKTEAEE